MEIEYEACECGAASQEGQGGGGRRPLEPLKEVWSEVREEGGVERGGQPSSSRGEGHVGLKWDCCGADVVLCDCCGNLVNVSVDWREKEVPGFPCRHCSFPVVVNSRYRTLLGLRPCNELSFEEVAETQARLVGREAYQRFKAGQLKALETQLRSAPRPETNSAEAGGNNRGRLRKKHRNWITGDRADPGRAEVTNQYIKSKWELATLARMGGSDRRQRERRKSLVSEQLQLLKLLYGKDLRWPEFWDVHSESHENVQAICHSAAEYLRESSAITSVRESAATMSGVLSCMREDVAALEKAGLPADSSSRFQMIESIAESFASSESCKFSRMVEKHLGVMESIRCEANKIVDCLRTNVLLAEDAAPDSLVQPKPFPAQAYGILLDLHGWLLEGTSV
ncbi:hypothetical protein HOP50_01g01900 [Chloropicon primus]|nr:hypothetical protein HOP50_01g01900 [Chloropicon primus]